MSDPSIFDRHAEGYAELVNAAITASGETVDFFAELRASLVRRNCAGDRAPAGILDFGCGTGRSTRALASAFPATRLTGFDPSRPSIEAARRLVGEDGGRVTFAFDEGLALPFAPGSFDLVFSSCVFHHIVPADRPRWLAEIRRVLTPAGTFFLFEHNPLNPLTVRVVRACPLDRDAQLLRPAEVGPLLEAAGLEAGRPRYYFFFPRVLRGLRWLEPHLASLPLGAQYFVTGTRPS